MLVRIKDLSELPLYSLVSAAAAGCGIGSGHYHIEDSDVDITVTIVIGAAAKQVHELFQEQVDVCQQLYDSELRKHG